jgi:hypothetical protein
MEQNDAEFVTPIEVWNLVDRKLGLNRIRTYFRDGLIPARRFGKTYVARKQDVEKFFQNYYLKTNN